MMTIPEIFKKYGVEERNNDGSVFYTLKGKGVFCCEEDRYETKELYYTPDEDPDEETFSVDVDNTAYNVYDLTIQCLDGRYIEIILPFGDEVWFNF